MPKVDIKNFCLRFTKLLMMTVALHWLFTATAIADTSIAGPEESQVQQAQNAKVQGENQALVLNGIGGGLAAWWHETGCVPKPAELTCALLMGGAIAAFGFGRSATNASVDAANFAARITKGNTTNPIPTWAPPDPDTNPLGAVGPVTKTQAYKKATEAYKQAQQAGWKVDPKTGKITTPNGKTLSFADLSSPKALANAGIPAPAIKQVTDAMAQATKEALKKAGEQPLGGNVVSIEETDGGGKGAGPSGVRGSSSPQYSFMMPKLPGEQNAPDKQPASVATEGLVRNFNGAPIGVAQEDLFTMVKRRYQKLDNQGYFIK